MGPLFYTVVAMPWIVVALLFVSGAISLKLPRWGGVLAVASLYACFVWILLFIAHLATEGLFAHWYEHLVFTVFVWPHLVAGGSLHQTLQWSDCAWLMWLIAIGGLSGTLAILRAR